MEGSCSTADVPWFFCPSETSFSAEKTQSCHAGQSFDSGTESSLGQTNEARYDKNSKNVGSITPVKSICLPDTNFNLGPLGFERHRFRDAQRHISDAS